MNGHCQHQQSCTCNTYTQQQIHNKQHIQYYGGSGGSFRARPEAEPMDAIHSHVIYVICIACHASCKPSGTKSLEAFFNCIYMLRFCINTRDTTHTHIYITAEVGEVSGLVPRRNPWMPYTHMPYVSYVLHFKVEHRLWSTSLHKKNHLLFFLSLAARKTN